MYIVKEDLEILGTLRHLKEQYRERFGERFPAFNYADFTGNPPEKWAAEVYKEKLEAFAAKEGLTTLTVQGELCAPGIQSNRLKLTKPEWYVFTIMENGKRVGLNRMQEICSELGFATVPIEEIDTNLPAKYPTVEALLVRADGNYPNGGKKEGIVIRPTEPVFSASIGAELSMKVVSNKYLLKNDG